MAKITFHNEPATTAGELPKVGSIAANFMAVSTDLKEKSLSDYKGHRIVLSIFPSVDTGVCAASVRRFNQEANNLKNTKILCISKDLPFAMARFCGAEGLKNVEVLSDFRGDFSSKYHVELLDTPLKGLLSRAIIVIDENETVIYTEQVDEITNEPDYEAVLNVLK
jgi:Peroxiredoxin